MIRALLFFLLLPFCIGATEIENRILFLMKGGNIEQAIYLYREQFEKTQQHDFELLQEMGILLLEWGVRQKEAETVLMVMFGAGLASHERGLVILEEGLRHPDPNIQMTAFHFFQRMPNQAFSRITRQLLSSPFLQLRLEALFSLASLKDPQTIHQVEALMSKVPSEAAVLFPEILAMVGTASSTRFLRKLMHHGLEEVRVASILAAAKYHRDDLLPDVQRLSQHPFPTQQEACAYALGVLGDDRSLPYLETILRSKDKNILLATHQALYRLGRKQSAQFLRDEAIRGDILAIRMLGQIEGCEEVLLELIKRGDLPVRINAGIALLEHHNPRCVPVLAEILFFDSRDLIVTPVSSRAGCLQAWKIAYCANQKFLSTPIVCELSAQLREQVLKQALQLPEKDFLILVDLIFEQQQNDLIPLTVRLLEELGTEQAIQFLKTHRQMLGAPWVRNWCNLALYRLGEEGPYGHLLCSFAKENQDTSLIQFRPILPWQLRQKVDQYELTVEERSRFLVETFEALARAQDDQGIFSLLEAIENGNKKNRYALAGLLLRAIH